MGNHAQALWQDWSYVTSAFLPQRKLLKRYEIERESYQTTYGKWYLATHLKKHVPVSIFVPHSCLLKTVEERNRFMSVMQQILKMRDAPIAKILEVGEQDEKCFIVTTYFSSDMLLNNDKHFHKSEVYEVAKCLQQILNFTFQNGLHGFLCMDNLLWHGTLSMFDYGVIQAMPKKPLIGWLSRSRQVLPYLAPEVLQVSAYADVKADIYSSAVVIGTLLFGSNSQEKWEQACEERNYPQELAQHLRKAIYHRPEQRPKVEGFIEPLLELLSDGQTRKHAPFVFFPAVAHAKNDSKFDSHSSMAVFTLILFCIALFLGMLFVGLKAGGEWKQLQDDIKSIKSGSKIYPVE